MGITYKFDHAERTVRARGWGVLSMPDIDDFYSRLQAEPAFDPSYRTLGDLLLATEIAVTSHQLASSAALPVFEPGTRRALVASRDAVYGMLCAFAAFNERLGQTVRIFRNMDAAEAWLAGGEDALWRLP
jgi:hypothetical protein